MGTFTHACIDVEDAAGLIEGKERNKSFVELSNDELVVLGIPLSSFAPVVFWNCLVWCADVSALGVHVTLFIPSSPFVHGYIYIS